MVNFGDLSLQRQKWLSIYGYTKAIPIHGEVGATELGMHMGAVGWKGITAFVHPLSEHMNYAYILCEDEKGNEQWIDGAFWLFPGGRFSVS